MLTAESRSSVRPVPEAGKRPTMPPEVREALIEALSDALAEWWRREHGADSREDA